MMIRTQAYTETHGRWFQVVVRSMMIRTNATLKANKEEFQVVVRSMMIRTCYCPL